eukprot:3775439-Rhodomonas_salina.3
MCLFASYPPSCVRASSSLHSARVRTAHASKLPLIVSGIAEHGSRCRQDMGPDSFGVTKYAGETTVCGK